MTDPPGAIAPPPPPHLSQELYDMFIDALAVPAGPISRADLLACCLVCRSWVHRARTHLYRQIRLRPLTNLEQYDEIYTKNCLLPYVRQVAIIGCLLRHVYTPDDAGSGLDDDEHPDHSWLDPAAAFLARFQNIELLHLYDLSWGDIKKETRDFFLTHFPDVTMLQLSSVDFWNANQLFRTLESFKHLLALSTDHISWHRANYTRRQMSQTDSMRLRRLMLGQTEAARYGPMITWLLGNRETFTVDEALISWEDTEIKSLVRLLRRIAPTLSCLVYQQSMQLPGSENAEARVATANALLGNPLPIVHAAAANPPAPIAPQVNQVPGTFNAGQINIIEGFNAGLIGFLVAADANDGNEGTDDEEVGDQDNEDDDDNLSDDHVRPSTPIELEDDEPEAEDVIAGFIEEDGNFVAEGEAMRLGLEHLDEAPITESSIKILQARVFCTTMALFGVKLMCQLVSPDTKNFTLVLILPSGWSGPVLRWSNLSSVLDWAAVNNMLAVAAGRVTSGTVLDLVFHGAVGRPLADANSVSLKSALREYLPAVFASGQWRVFWGNTLV
ncbi:uncharacterized protein FIBRA_08431 [Fibroporia radiculosa]|uniref:F-box domain-containing protein n=1 Tax=Fibroporia radiculosa TaxID=599839 RepID=J4H563_9APHY|nr:uncharacterized protein FIBRA_08431 [Fibroporia radiculosa]CCM06189.1 predicted protein [Fibroporia radiculosa]